MSKLFMDLAGQNAADFQGPVFIVGVPRSGTKLLRDLMNRHERVGIPDEESQFLPEFFQRFGTHPALDQESARLNLVNALQNSNFARLMLAKGLKLDQERILAACAQGSLAAIFEATIRSYLPPEKANDPELIWGDKTPFHALHLPMLAALYPSARFIHIIRDPRDVAFSMKLAWHKSLLRAAVDWRESLRATWDFRDNPQRTWPFLELYYEDLLDSPQEILTAICQFCGLDFDPRMLSLLKSTETRGQAKNITTILRSNSKKYLEKGRPNEIRLVEELAFQQIMACGYELHFATGFHPESKLRLSCQKIIDGLRVLLVYMREKGIVAGLRYKLQHRFLRYR